MTKLFIRSKDLSEQWGRHVDASHLQNCAIPLNNQTWQADSKRALRMRVWFLFWVLPIALLGLMCYGMTGADAAPAQVRSVTTGPSQALRYWEETRGLTGTVRGLLLSVPQDLTGTWEVRTGPAQTQSLLVDDLSVVEDDLLQLLQNGLPSTNTWVYAKVELQIGGLAVVTEIRLHNYEPGEVVARLEEGVTASDIASRYNINLEATLLSSGNIHLFTTPQQDIDVKALVAQMALDNDILWADLNYRGSASEAHPYGTWSWGGPEPTSYINQIAFEQVNLPPALERYRGDGIVVAILDTGIDLNHPALVGRLAPGIDLVDDDDDPQDEGPGMGWGNGTHVAGIIARIAPNSTLLPVRVLDSDGQGNVFTLAYAVGWAVEQGAHVINLSLGSDQGSEILRNSLADALAAGVIIVASAGNENSATIQYPAGYAGVIGVTAVTSDNHKSGFANYGSWVALAAPGEGITSTIIVPEGSGYAVWRGTSMATAFVSGAAALARQKFPISSTLEISQLLTVNARNIDAMNPEYAGQLGGLLDIGAALADQSPTATATPTPTPLASETPAATPIVTLPPTVMPTPTVMPSPTPDAPADSEGRLLLPMLFN